MSNPAKASLPPKLALASRVDELREAIRMVPVDLLAEHTGTSYQDLESGKGEFHFTVFGSPTVVTFPELVGCNTNGEDLPLLFQGVLAYYFQTSDGEPLSGQWVSFAELPDGRMYNQAFQGYSGDKLVKVFGQDVEFFRSACELGGGVATSMGDAAYVFHALPRVPMAVNFWCGDEDFPSTCKILFDKTTGHYLPTDACAILGSVLTGRLEKYAA